MTNRILVAYDGTEAADQAFEVALGAARQRGAGIHVIAVASAAEVETHVMHDRLRVECAAYLRPLPARGAAVHVDVEVEVTEGIPAWEIAGAARRIGADLIVIGHRRRSLLRRCMETSVAKRVLDRAPCAVLVAPPPARSSP
jgi:nucleotide-binding universal stress UspA family protein